MSIGVPFVGLMGSGDSHGSDSLTSSPGFCATALFFPFPFDADRPPIAANTMPATASAPIAMIAANCFCCACRDFFALGFDFDFRNELAESISTCDGRALGADSGSGSANAPNGLSLAAGANETGAGAGAAGTNGGGTGAGCGGANICCGMYCGAP